MTRPRTSRRRITHYGTVAIGETPFQASIIQMAELRGYRAYHVANVKGQLRNETAVGFQDLLIAGKGMIIFAENKSETGQLTAEQKEMVQRDIRMPMPAGTRQDMAAQTF